MQYNFYSTGMKELLGLKKVWGRGLYKKSVSSQNIFAFPFFYEKKKPYKGKISFALSR